VSALARVPAAPEPLTFRVSSKASNDTYSPLSQRALEHPSNVLVPAKAREAAHATSVSVSRLPDRRRRVGPSAELRRASRRVPTRCAETGPRPSLARRQLLRSGYRPTGYRNLCRVPTRDCGHGYSPRGGSRPEANQTDQVRSGLANPVNNIIMGA
jgi:hypothetical protein